MRSWSFAKGHGTENDFVILLDRHDLLAPTPEDVRFLCDRRAGIGGDGLLRAVKAEHIPEWDGPDDLWFMDYRNADGSIAEMCGNGIRVFARYLVEKGLLGSTADIGTRAGLKHVEILGDGRVRVDMGEVRPLGETAVVHAGHRFGALGVDVGNPHAVCGTDHLDALDLTQQPEVDATVFPDDANVEFVMGLRPRHIAMRVFERGVGETRSCGTGTVAAATAARIWAGEDQDASWRVDVPGGTVEITFEDDRVFMTGPAVIVAHGEVDLPDHAD